MNSNHSLPIAFLNHTQNSTREKGRGPVTTQWQLLEFVGSHKGYNISPLQNSKSITQNSNVNNHDTWMEEQCLFRVFSPLYHQKDDILEESPVSAYLRVYDRRLSGNVLFTPVSLNGRALLSYCSSGDWLDGSVPARIKFTTTQLHLQSSIDFLFWEKVSLIAQPNLKVTAAQA